MQTGASRVASRDRVRRLAEVQEAFRTLPERYLGRRARLRRDLPHPPRATSATRGRSAVPPTAPASAPASPAATPDVVIGTDAETWLRAAPGRPLRRRGVLAAPPLRPRRPRPRGRLRGHVPPPQRPPAAAAHPRRRVERGTRISTLTMGEGPDVLLLHGLGGDQDLVLRHRGGAQPRATASTRSTCPASAARASPRWPATARRTSPARCSA